MLALKLVRLIEQHSEELATGLTDKLRRSDRTYDFCKVPTADLHVAAVETYRNLGDWLLQKTEDDIAERFKALAARCAREGVGLRQFVWALVISRNHLWQFLQQETFADNIVELFGELELQRKLTQFFDRAVYYGVLGYAEASEERETPNRVVAEPLKVGEVAVSIRVLGIKRRLRH